MSTITRIHFTNCMSYPAHIGLSSITMPTKFTPSVDGNTLYVECRNVMFMGHLSYLNSINEDTIQEYHLPKGMTFKLTDVHLG